MHLTPASASVREAPKSREFLARARARHEQIFSRALNESAGQAEADPVYCERVDRLLLIVGSSRSGSSWLANILQSSSSFCSLMGEIDPLLLLTLIDRDAAADAEPSDLLSEEDVNQQTSEKLSLLLSWLAGSRKIRDDYWSLSARERFGIAMRTLWQWPDLRCDGAPLLHAIDLCFDCHGGQGSASQSMIHYLHCLKGLDDRINPLYYDLPYWQIRRSFPKQELPSGPPSSEGLIEEPPFVPFTPWVPASPGQRLRNPLILKSPSNSYRLDFLRALFPNAAITIVHVVRDPVSSITGLMSGWRHHGFFKHLMPPGSLKIAGYSNPSLPWTGEWWKFDLPPGWRRYADGTLAEVCAQQWLSANDHVLHWIDENWSEISYVQLHYESDLRLEVLRLCRILNMVPDLGLLQALRSKRRIMASAGIAGEVKTGLRREAETLRHRPAIGETQRAIRDAKHRAGRENNA